MTALASKGPPRRIAARVARSESEVESLAYVWDALGVTYVDAELDHFLTSLRMLPRVERPYVLVLEHDGVPKALGVGRIESARFPTRFGYATVYQPTLRALRISHGGASGIDDRATAHDFVRELERALAEETADVYVVPAVRVDSPLDEALRAIPTSLRRHSAEPSVHRRLLLPKSYEELLARRDRKSRYNLKRQSTKLEHAFDGRLAIDVLSEVDSFGRVIRDLEQVASSTYQRGLGAGFVDTPERRALVRLGLEKGEFRAWVLSIDGAPVAFWQGTARGKTFFLNTAGFKPELGQYGVGTYVQLCMFHDLCDDPDVEVVDFGWGDADYKARFGNESWLEHDVTVFAPTVRGIRISLLRHCIVGLHREARRVAQRSGTLGRVKRIWRRRLRPVGIR